MSHTSRLIADLANRIAALESGGVLSKDSNNGGWAEDIRELKSQVTDLHFRIQELQDQVSALQYEVGLDE